MCSMKGELRMMALSVACATLGITGGRSHVDRQYAATAKAGLASSFLICIIDLLNRISGLY